MSRPSTATTAARTPGVPNKKSDLIGARLPKWAPYGAGVGAVVLALGLRSLLDWTGWYTAFFTAAVLFIVILTAWSFSVEGRRRAKDRFATTLVCSSFVAAIVPLVLILGYIGIKGISVFSADFFLKSMNGVTSR